VLTAKKSYRDISLAREARMGWTVVYEIPGGQEQSTIPLSSREAALREAKDLRRQDFVIVRIEGPNGEQVPLQEIDWT
jgi:hypothetical protein